MQTDVFQQDSDTERQTLFAAMLLPVPIPKLFTYRVPRNLSDRVQVGKRAIVQFGDRKIMTGVVAAVSAEPPKGLEAKYILDILDEFPVLSDLQFRLFQWIADYYACTQGEVLNAALPSGLKLSSESMVQLHPAFSLEESIHSFSEKEVILIKRLENGDTLTYTEITELLGVKQLYSILKSLAGKEAIILFEEVREKFKPKTDRRIRLQEPYTHPEKLEELFDLLASQPKQEAILLKYLQEVPVLHNATSNRKGLSKKELLADAELSESSLSTLIKHNILEAFEVVVSRFEDQDEEDLPHILLSQEQQQAQLDIIKNFSSHAITLLHGITGSGKTAIYINLIKQALEGGTQVLYLLPEIALTTQIVRRLKKVFGTTMGVYHSRFSDNERVEVWNGVISGKFKFIVGVRSSVFLPFDNLGLIIVDEEHDASYKQQEPAPRYHARDTAIMMAQFHHAKVLLGSATPSVESFYQAQEGKYGYIRLDKRFGDAKLPELVMADMSKERKLKTVKGEFSGMLLTAIGDTLERKEQVIIFQNRRGYSPVVNCEDCGWVPKCINCAVSLTYHQFRNALVCHYCGYKESLPSQCPTCTSNRLKTVGYGTEKLEEELSLHFQDAQVQRMDLDTTRSKTGYELIIENFEKGETNILVGTQMVTKGLDFDHVSLVGIFNADRMIHFPDFRSYERAFQLITQVSGRAGRRDKPGTVIIQTADPEHPLLQILLTYNDKEFYRLEIADRRQHEYPPFTRLIEITVKHTDKKTCRTASEKLAEMIKVGAPGIKVLGPGEPMISKIRNLYLMNILLKIARGKGDLQQIKQSIHQNVQHLLKEKDFRSVKVVIDVDPV